MAKKEVPEDEGPSQEWLASYADAMTLLLAFFIMMFAFALVDEGKFFDFKVGVTAAFGIPDPVTDYTESILAKGTGIAPELGPVPIPRDEAAMAAAEELEEALEASGLITPENALKLKKVLEDEFERLGASDIVDVGIDERGVFIRFDGQVLFASNRTELNADGLTLLATSATVLQAVDNMLEIEGHTDDQPTRSPWPSNWELSSARASGVVRWLIDFGNIPAPQLIAVGRADTRPRESNDTTEGRALNRRVEIVVRINATDREDLEKLAAQADPPIEEVVDLDETFDTGLPPTPNVNPPSPDAPGDAETINEADTETTANEADTGSVPAPDE